MGDFPVAAGQTMVLIGDSITDLTLPAVCARMSLRKSGTVRNRA
jgi:hypothetical protein